jgi:hypothetical protein
MLCHVASVRTDVSEELSASIIHHPSSLSIIHHHYPSSIIHHHYPFLCSVHQLLVMANVVPSSPILVTLMMEALSSSETSIFTRATRCNIPEDAILHSHCYENLKSYIRVHWLAALCFFLLPSSSLSTIFSYGTLRCKSLVILLHIYSLQFSP